MTSDAFRDYIEGKFRVDLAEQRLASLEAFHRLGIPGPEKCEHHHVPHSRLVPLDPRIPISGRQEVFWAAWYVTSLLHQAVHRYASDQEHVWLDRFGAHPLPMVAAGLGCWKAAKPAFLLDRLREDTSVTTAACEYIRDKAPKILEDAQIAPGALSLHLLADRDFDLRHPVERLVGNSIIQWQITPV